MAKITLKGSPVNTSGNLPAVGSIAPDFAMVKNDLSEVKLSAIHTKYKVLNIFPSVDTGTCAMSVKKFNQSAAELKDVAILNVSKDLPFAQKRFCGAEGINQVETVSVFRHDFAKAYQLEIVDGPLKGLCSRAILVLDKNNKVLHAEQVAEIANEPNYATALKALSK